MSQPDYADLCEWYSSMGLSGSDAAHYAGSGIVPEIEEEDESDEESDDGLVELTHVRSAGTGVACEGWEGPCESLNATRQRQNTQYVDDEQNWVTLCPECMEANCAHWKDMWRDYYSDKL